MSASPSSPSTASTAETTASLCCASAAVTGAPPVVETASRNRAEVFADGDRIEAHDIVFDAGPAEAAAAPADTSASLGGQVREREFAVIRSALAACAGRRAEAAHRLGISERTLRYKLAAMAAGATARAVTLQ